MSALKASELHNAANTQLMSAARLADSYYDLRIPVGAGWFDAMNGACVDGGRAAELSSAMQSRMLEAADAYNQVAKSLAALTELFGEARQAIRSARNIQGEFIID